MAHFAFFAFFLGSFLLGFVPENPMGNGGTVTDRKIGAEVYNLKRADPVFPDSMFSVNALPNQSHTENEELTGTLFISAQGGLGPITFSAENLPPGVTLDPSTGRIFGILSATASLGSPYQVRLVARDSSLPAPREASTIVTWEVSAFEAWKAANENQNYTARHENSFVQAGEAFYLMGGRENSTTIDIYNFSQDTWRSLPNIAPKAFNHFQATEYKGYIWVIGSFENNNFPDEAPASHIWIFDPVREQYIQGPEIPADRRRGSAGLVVYKDKFYIVCGNRLGHNGQYVDYFDEFDPATGTWRVLPSAPRPRDHFSAVVAGDKLYAISGRLSGGPGGTFAPVVKEVDVYDFVSGTWSTLPSALDIPTGRAGAVVANFKNRIIVAGGEVAESSSAFKLSEIFDPENATWSQGPSMNFARHGTQGIVSGDGLFVTAGSPTRGGNRQKNMEYLGVRNPTGVTLVPSLLNLPQSAVLDSEGRVNISMSAGPGNQAVVIRSLFFIGSDASDFTFVAPLVNGFTISPNSSISFDIRYLGSKPNPAAQLQVGFGTNSVAHIDISRGTAPPNEPDNLMVGHWKMDEENGPILVDHSGKGNNATVANTIGLSRVPGKEGLALRVTGNSFGTVPHTSDFAFSDALTIAVWIKPSIINRRTILSKGSPDGFFLRTDNNGKIEFRFNHTTNGTLYRMFSNQSYPTNGTWMHVAVTFNGTRTTMYINGVQDNTASYPATVIRPNTTSLQIGGWDGINRWIGDLDELRLYAKVLSPEEILQLASEAPPAPQAPAIIGPDDGSSSSTVEEVPLVWESSALAEGYQVQISDGPDFNNLLVNSDLGNALSYLPESLPTDIPLFWRVRAYNGSGNSAWSQVRSFVKTEPVVVVDLVGHWKMDEGSGNVLLDHSGKGNNATVANTSGMSWVSGRENLALRVGGNNFGVVPHNASLEFSNAITVAAWIKPSGVGRRTIIAKGAPDGFFLRTENNGKIEFRFNHNTNGTQFRVFSNQSYPTNGTWMHVSVTFNGSSTTIYINGVQDNSASYAPTLIRPNTTNLQIAGWDGINRWIGDLDDVRLYNRALGAAEILQLAAGGNARMAAGPAKDKGGDPAQEAKDHAEGRQVESREVPLEPRLYPNPVLNKLQVEGLWIEEGNIEVQIWDMQERMRLESAETVVQRSVLLDLNSLGLEPGVYVIAFKDKYQIQLFKLLKE